MTPAQNAAIDRLRATLVRLAEREHPAPLTEECIEALDALCAELAQVKRDAVAVYDYYYDTESNDEKTVVALQRVRGYADEIRKEGR